MSGSTVHSYTQATPGWTELSQAGAPQPRPSSGLQGPNFELVELQKALTSTMVKGLFVPARRDFCISFSLCVVCGGGFELNQRKGREEEHSRLETSGHRAALGCVSSPPTFLSKARVPSADRRLGFRSSIRRSGWRGALCFPEASGWLNFRRRIGGPALHRLCCA